MLNQRRLDLLKDLAAIERAKPPFLSVYLDIRPDGAARRECLTFLRDAVLDHTSDRKSLPYHGAALKGFDDDLAWITECMGDYSGGRYDPASHGIVFFACGARDIRRAVELPTPFANRFHVGEAPLLAPLAATVAREPDYVVALVDVDTCRVFSVSLGEVTAEAERQGDTADLSWTARGGGWSHKRYQRHIDHWRSKFAGEAAGLIAETVRNVGAPYVVLIGEEWARAEVRRHLPEQMLPRLLDGGHLMVDWSNAAQVVAAAEPITTVAAQGYVRAEADRVLTAAAEGRPAAVGVGQTLRALEEGAVHELVLLPSLDVAAWRCDSCGHIEEGAVPAQCRVCGGSARAVGLGEAVLRAALAQDAELVYVDAHDDLAAHGGVGALLRFAVVA